jgi:general secretion pathway protein A
VVAVPAAPAAAPPLPAAPRTYESFYGLMEKPFTLAIDPKFVYASGSYASVIDELAGAFARHERLLVLTGDLGTGRTTLCRGLVERLGRRVLSCFVSEPVGTFEELLTLALVAFGVITGDGPTRSRVAASSRDDLIAAVDDFCESLAPARASLMVIDDAHNVPTEVLEPLAAVLAAGGNRGLQVLLVGTPGLRSRLELPELARLHRLVGLSCQLDPLASAETSAYVAHRLKVAGAKADAVFDADAISALHAVTHGVPRTINLVADRALARGFAVSAAAIDRAVVDASASDLDLAPPDVATPRPIRKPVIALVVGGSLLAGAAAAAWMFRADVTRLLRLIGL